MPNHEITVSFDRKTLDILNVDDKIVEGYASNLLDFLAEELYNHMVFPDYKGATIIKKKKPPQLSGGDELITDPQ
jgi:hypothetical protein